MRRFKTRFVLLLCFSLLFSSLPFERVAASSIQNDSSPIFGLTPDQVVEKYNSLTSEKKESVLKALGNTSIFANSLFGNILNTGFGFVSDAVEKLGDLFFQANGVVYHLGSSALSWVYRLIDRVFNDDLQDLNISQPVVDDLYLNTRSLSYIIEPIFQNGHRPDFISSVAWDYIFPLPLTDGFCYCAPKGTFWGSYDSCLIVPYYNNNSVLYGLFVDLDNSVICLGTANYSVNNFNQLTLLSLSHNAGALYSAIISSSGPLVGGRWNNYGVYNNFNYPLIYDSFVGDFYSEKLNYYLNKYFVNIDYFFVISDDIITQVAIDHNSSDVNVTNNTYYNYIYNIPDMTPMNVTNIVSNTAINYNPVENIIKYVPEGYNIEQNFSVVNNYYISSGSSISSPVAIDVNIVSPDVINVRLVNPEDISNTVNNEVNQDILNNYNFNIGDLNFNGTINTALNGASNDFDKVASGSAMSFIGSMIIACVPDDIYGFVWRFLLIMVCIFVYNSIRHKQT